MALPAFRLFFLFSVFSPFLEASTLTFAYDYDSRLIEQTYIYDMQGHLKEEVIDSSGAVSTKERWATCNRLNASTNDAKTADSSSLNSNLKLKWDPHRSGAAGEEQVKRALEAKGEKVLGREITLKTSAGKTRADMVIRNTQGELEVVEVKNGRSAKLTPNQDALFRLIQQEGAEPTGKNAVQAGLLEKMGPTPVRIIRTVACP